MIEIELKCQITPHMLETLHEKIQTWEYKGTVQNRDTYYDTSSFDLLEKAVFVRVRNNARIEFKFNENIDLTHQESIERTFPFLLSFDMAKKMNTLFTHFFPSWVSTLSFEDAIKQNGLMVLATINNTRKKYVGGDIILSIDHIEELGDFLEVELQAEEGMDTRKAQERLQTFVADLNGEHIKVGYVELWLYKHNPQAYAIGRYHL